MVTEIHAAVARTNRWPTGRPLRLRYQLVTLIIAFAPMMSPAGARGDELQVRKTEFSPSSGTVVATISALGPPDTAIAVRLYRQGCPANPEGEDVQPGLTANGQSYEVPALADEPGVSGNWDLCIWTIHENGLVGARYQHPVRLPKPPPPAWNPVIGTNHPWWWAFVGWSTLLAFIAVLVGAGLSRRVLRSSRRRRGRTQDPFGNPLDRHRGPLEEVRQAANGGAVRNEADTLEFGALGHRGAEAAHRQAGAGDTHAGTHPFVRPPAPGGELALDADPPGDDDGSPGNEDE